MEVIDANIEDADEVIKVKVPEENKVVEVSIAEVHRDLEKLGYYPTREIVLETALNLKRYQIGGKVGQGIQAICLDGPPGAGKSFYAKTYKKLAERLFNEPIHLVSYQCNTDTGKSDLYEEINIVSAITSDADNVIIYGKLAEAIKLVNEGKKVVLFLDEYDKSRNETDPFLLGFLQDGEIDTTQKGKLKIQEKYLKNLQVIICKNDERELSGPLSRRLKSLKLDYMKPDMLCRTINRQLGDYNQAIKDAIIMLYTSIYEKHMADVYVFERIPSCSECMQAISDAQMLMDMGAGKQDIVATAIVANLFKTENDIETLKALLQNEKDNEFVQWYKYLVDVVGNNNELELERVKEEMARNFYPEQLKVVTKELEKKKVELEEQTKKLQTAKEEYKERFGKIEEREMKLNDRETEINKKEQQVEILRANAQEDALATANQYLDKQSAQLKAEYDEKEQQLQSREQETARLRENAKKDALKKAQEQIEIERRKTEEEFDKKTEEINRQVQEKIEEVNQQIKRNNEELEERLTDYSYVKSRKQHAEQLLEEKEEEIKEQKKLLEKLLGRKVRTSDFEQTSQEDSKIEVDENKSFSVHDDIDGEIQVSGNSSSVFEVSSNNNWIKIGEIQLETSEEKETLEFTEEASKNLGQILTGEKFKKQKPMVCDDGIVLYQGNNSKLVAIRVIQEENGKYKNIYQFYSNSMVVPIQALQMLTNMVANLNACGASIISNTPIPMQLKCLVCSNKKHESSPPCIFEKLDEGIYYMKYENESEIVPLTIAKYLISKKGINCSIKDMTKKELDQIEKKAFIKHCELEGGQKQEMIQKINTLDIVRMDREKEGLEL